MAKKKGETPENVDRKPENLTEQASAAPEAVEPAPADRTPPEKPEPDIAAPDPKTPEPGKEAPALESVKPTAVASGSEPIAETAGAVELALPCMDPPLERLEVLADRHRVPTWQQAALARMMGWAAGKQVSEAEYAAALSALTNRRIGGGRVE